MRRTTQRMLIRSIRRISFTASFFLFFPCFKNRTCVCLQHMRCSRDCKEAAGATDATNRAGCEGGRELESRLIPVQKYFFPVFPAGPSFCLHLLSKASLQSGRKGVDDDLARGIYFSRSCECRASPILSSHGIVCKSNGSQNDVIRSQVSRVNKLPFALHTYTCKDMRDRTDPWEQLPHFDSRFSIQTAHLSQSEITQ